MKRDYHVNMRKIPCRRCLIWGGGAAALLVVCALIWLVVAGRGSAGGIVVPRDFPTIQSALDRASPGDTIIVRASGGPYPGPLVIQTPDVSILAADGRAVIACDDTEPGITIKTRGVTLRGFEVKANGIGVRLKLASGAALDDLVITGARIGIQVDESDANMLTAINVRNGEVGIEMKSADRNVLRRIRIDAVADVGIRLSNAWLNTVEHATVNGARVGISLADGSEENRIASFVGNECGTSGVEILDSSSNTVTTSTLAGCAIGVSLNTADNNTVENNRIKNSRNQGIALYKSRQNTLSLNTIVSSRGNGIHISDSRGDTVAYNSVTECSDAGIRLERVESSLFLGNRVENNAVGIQCHEGSRNRVLRNELSGNTLAGIVLSEGADNLFLDNTVTESPHGIALIGSTGNQFLRNDVTACSADGVSLLNHSDRNLIQDNTIERDHIGVLIAASSRGTVTDNRISGCETAIRLFQSGTGTRVEGNLIVDNSIGLEVSSQLEKDETILGDVDAELLQGDTEFQLVLTNNTFARNTSYDISNTTDKTVYAAGNCWGDRHEERLGRVVGKVVLPRSSWKGTIAIGTTDSLDQIIIGRLLQLALVADGVKVIDLIGLGDAEMVKEALLAGDVDLAIVDPSFVNADDLSDRGIVISHPLAVEDRLSLVVSPDIAKELPGGAISDLAAYLSARDTTLKLAVQRTIPREQVQSLVSAYGIPLTADNIVWTTGIDETETLLKLGTVNTGIVHSIEETVTMLGFRVLADERNIFAVSHTAFLTAQRVIAALPEVSMVEQQLRPLLTTDNVHSLVVKVRLLHREPREVAQEFMLQHGLIER